MCVCDMLLLTAAARDRGARGGGASVVTYHVEAPALHFSAGERGTIIFARVPLDVLIWLVEVD